jgi:hypothetical protein
MISTYSASRGSVGSAGFRDIGRLTRRYKATFAARRA